MRPRVHVAIIQSFLLGRSSLPANNEWFDKRVLSRIGKVYHKSKVDPIAPAPNLKYILAFAAKFNPTLCNKCRRIYTKFGLQISVDNGMIFALEMM